MEKENNDEDEFNYERYAIKKGKTDLISSLKALNKNLLKEKMKNTCSDNIKELKEYIMDSFEITLENTKEDSLTKEFFKNLLEYENTEIMAAHEMDIESLFVFIYQNDDHYSYYIPDEIKKLIKKILKFKKRRKYEQFINI